MFTRGQEVNIKIDMELVKNYYETLSTLMVLRKFQYSLKFWFFYKKYGSQATLTLLHEFLIGVFPCTAVYLTKTWIQLNISDQFIILQVLEYNNARQ